MCTKIASTVSSYRFQGSQFKLYNNVSKLQKIVCCSHEDIETLKIVFLMVLSLMEEVCVTIYFSHLQISEIGCSLD